MGYLKDIFLVHLFFSKFFFNSSKNSLVSPSTFYLLFFSLSQTLSKSLLFELNIIKYQHEFCLETKNTDCFNPTRPSFLPFTPDSIGVILFFSSNQKELNGLFVWFEKIAWSLMNYYSSSTTRSSTHKGQISYEASFPLSLAPIFKQSCWDLSLLKENYGPNTDFMTWKFPV